MSFDLLVDGLWGRAGEQADQFLILPQEAQQDVLGFYNRRTKLTGLVAGEENCPPSLLGVSLKHGLLRSGYSTTASLPVEISRHADQHNRGTPESFGWPPDDGVECPGSTNQNVDRRQPRVSRAAIGAGNVGSFPAQDEQADDGQRVREHHAKHHIGVKLIVAAADGEDSCPNAL